ncbi:hypothetical protein MSPP1_000204 [Malassezia sp. CBS 17886]|nr:hypothetical protein MSPP1_000204 [Malassezia sp. CBS 17886]
MSRAREPTSGVAHAAAEAPRASAHRADMHSAGDAAEEAASRYVTELTAQLLGGAAGVPTAADASTGAQSPTDAYCPLPHPAAAPDELDATTSASLEKFMASLKAHLQLAPDAVAHGADAAPRRVRAHAWTPAERRRHVADTVAAYMGAPNDGAPGMTTVRCLHAAVAQKSYGTEKRFLCPPPAVHVQGPVRHGSGAPMLYMQVQGEDGDRFSGEQLAMLDDTRHARFNELHVTGTGKAKSFRLHLHMLHPHGGRDAHSAAKRMRLAHAPPGAPPAAPPGNASWATFDSAPIGIISKPSKKTSKARSAAAPITSNTAVSLFNRINSQTYRTKYLCAHDGRLSAQSRAWTAFRLVVLARPYATYANGGEDAVLTYGATIVLVDIESGTATDPLVVCRVERGRILLPHSAAAAAANDGDESHGHGAVGQMQKIALLRFVPRAGAGDALALDPGAPRSYLCTGGAVSPWGAACPGGARSSAGALSSPGARSSTSPLSPPDVLPAPDDAHVLPLVYAPPKAHMDGGAGTPGGDGAEDAFCWTLVGISHFEYSFIDVDMGGMGGPAGATLALTPFPIVTTMPFYDAPTHKLAFTVQHFSYLADAAALQTPTDAAAGAAAGAAGDTMEVWLGPLGPLPLVATPAPERGDADAEVAVQLPPLKDILHARMRAPASAAPVSQRTLPLLFVRGFDGTIYHSGRHILCQDLVAVVQDSGDAGAANALRKLNVGLGVQAGADDLPEGGAWTIRVV